MHSGEVTDLSSERPGLERDVEREMPLPSGSIAGVRINSFGSQKVSQGAVSAEASFNPLNNVCERWDEALAATGGGDAQCSAWERCVVRSGGVYTVVVPGPKWKSWFTDWKKLAWVC